MIVKGKRAKMTSTTSVHYTADDTEDIEDYPSEEDCYEEETETLYMGTPSEARRRFQGGRQPFS